MHGCIQKQRGAERKLSVDWWDATFENSTFRHGHIYTQKRSDPLGERKVRQTGEIRDSIMIQYHDSARGNEAWYQHDERAVGGA